MAGCTSAPTVPPVTRFDGELAVYRAVRDRVAPAVQRLVEKNKLQGVSIALVDDQSLVWAEGFGLADHAANVPATAQTVYRTGSIAKLFTATAVMQLAESGDIDLDAPLQTYLPSFHIRSRFSDAPPITARNLLTHHAGLPGDRYKGMWTSDSFLEVADQLHEEYVTFPPDFIFSYSNLGYSLLGHLVQEISGEAFSDHMRRRLFEPLGMANSAFSLTPRLQGKMAKGYRDGREEPLRPIRDQPALSLYSSVQDLAQFMMMVLANGSRAGQTVIGEAALAQMMRPQNERVALDFDTRVGLGWSLEPGRLTYAAPVVRHGGTTPLFSSELLLLPRHKLGVVVLSNSANGRSLVGQLAESILILALQAKSGLLPPDRPAPLQRPARGERQAPASPGEYATQFGIIAIYPDRNELCACTLGQTFDLVPYSNGWFGVGGERGNGDVFGRLRRMRFTREVIAGREVLVSHHKGRRVAFGERVLHAAPVSPRWHAREGRYAVVNPDASFPLEDVALRRKDGTLYLEYRMPVAAPGTIRLPLAPVSEEAAVTLGLGRSRGETLRVIRAGDHERLHYSGYELVRLD